MVLKESRLIYSVFAGCSDMGARMRSFDWSKTVLAADDYLSK